MSLKISIASRWFDISIYRALFGEGRLYFSITYGNKSHKNLISFQRFYDGKRMLQIGMGKPRYL